MSPPGLPGFTANTAAASIKWYCDGLGFAVKERWEHDGQRHNEPALWVAIFGSCTGDASRHI